MPFILLLQSACEKSEERAVIAAHPTGTIADVAKLRERDDINILFILIDTLRADHLGSYGYERPTSPALDALARDGIRFDRHLAQSSWTKCSMASLWTGLYPSRTGVLRFDHALPESATLPAEILQASGFETAAIWRNGWVAPNFGFSQGFDSYHSPRPTPVPAEVRREKPTVGLDGSDNDAMHSAVEFLRSRRDERWFLYLHLMDVHQYAYDGNSALFGTEYSDLYDNSIHWVDYNIGELIRTLEHWGVRDRTLIVIASDHGEAFGEHGTEGHARNLYTELTRTPLIISLPFSLEEGITINSPSQNVDIWPTILDLVGQQPLPDTDGKSLVQEIAGSGDAAGERTSSDRLRFSQLDQAWGRPTQDPRPLITVDDGSYRLVYSQGRPERSELFDLKNDPKELQDKSQAEPEIAARLAEDAERYFTESSVPWPSGTPSVDVDNMLLQQLRALGYDVR